MSWKMWTCPFKVSTPVTICIPKGTTCVTSPAHDVSQWLIPAAETVWHSLAELFQLFTAPRPWPEAVQLFHCCTLYTSSLAVFMNKKTWRKARCGLATQSSKFTSWSVKLPECIFPKLQESGTTYNTCLRREAKHLEDTWILFSVHFQTKTFLLFKKYNDPRTSLKMLWYWPLHMMAISPGKSL